MGGSSGQCVSGVVGILGIVCSSVSISYSHCGWDWGVIHQSYDVLVLCCCLDGGQGQWVRSCEWQVGGVMGIIVVVHFAYHLCCGGLLIEWWWW